MNEFYETKKYTLAKFVFLAIFMLSLLAGKLVVVLKSRVLMSGPIKAGYCGLSVRMPSGNGWDFDGLWQRQLNKFILTSKFMYLQDKIIPTVYCRYILASPDFVSKDIFEKNAQVINGEIIETGQRIIEPFTVEWAHIRSTDASIEMFFATSYLGNSRRLEIEMLQTTNKKFDGKVFGRILETLGYKENPAFKAGKEFVYTVKAEGVNSFVRTNQQSYSLIKDPRNRHIGFEMNLLSDSGGNSGFNIHVENFSYIKGRYSKEELSVLECNNQLSRFDWKRKSLQRTGRAGTVLNLDEDGVFIIKDLNRQTEERLKLSPVAIPGVFLEPVLGRLRNSRHENIILDIVEADGKIIPVLITKEQDAIHVEVFNNPNLSQKIYMSEDGRISKQILEDIGITIEQTSVEKVLNLFPEKADYILQKAKTSQEEQI
ncbi:MAG: hypothetical protein ACYSSI_09285 [Planctomycetota bacterium]|jgi:hypothetical protein